MVRIVQTLILISVLLFPTLGLSKVVRIGTLTDGPTRERLLYDAIIQETTSLLSGEFTVVFPQKHQLEGKWTKESVKHSLNKLLSAKEVDVVITIGLLSCHEACCRKRLPKPVFAPTIVEGTMPDIPHQKGTSGVRNLNYLDTFSSFERDVSIFLKITPFDELVVLVDRSLLEGIPGISLLAERTERNLGVSIIPIPIDGTMNRLSICCPRMLRQSSFHHFNN